MHRMKTKLSALALCLCLMATLVVTAGAAGESDIAGHWAKSALETFIENGYLKADDKGNYGPDDALTRAQFTAMINQITGQSEKSVSDEVLSRQEAVVMVADLLGLGDSRTDLTLLDRFTDGGEISSEARQGVAAMVAAGYIHGTDTGAFLPAKQLTRAEGVTILNNALDALAAPVIPTTGTVYGTATLTYAEFYSGDVSTVDGYVVDGVSSATNSKYNIMSNMYTNFQDAETNAEGYNILGVKNVNVAVDAADYQAYIALNPTFKVSRTVPEQYKTVTIVDGKAVYSATTFHVADTVNDAVATLKTGSVWGDYEIDVTETSTKYLRNSRADEGFAVNSQIQGVILEGTLKDGSAIKVGMEYLQSIWVQPYEVSFNVSADSAYNAHIGAWDNLSELSKLVGASITSITYIMQDSAYVYQFSDGIYIKPVYTGGETISASFTEGSAEVGISSIPADLKDVTVTVSYGSGRSTTTVASAVKIQNGKVIMDSAYDSEQTYTVKVSSSNYADIVAAVPMSKTQRTQLEALVEQAKTLIDNGTAAKDEGVKEHYAEALELLADPNATAAETAELITDLTGHLSVYVTDDTSSQGGQSGHGGQGGQGGHGGQGGGNPNYQH